jgi:hypothetical protein
MNNELCISILFSVIVVYNLFSSLKYTIFQTTTVKYGTFHTVFP